MGGPEPAPPPVVGAVLCGGRSARFGTDKALAPAGDRLVGEWVVTALRQAGADPVMAVGGTAGPTLNIPTVPDLRPGDGPLAGLATALLWAKTGSVVVVPCDMPLLRPGDVAPLVSAARQRPDAAVVATVDGKPMISLAVWPASSGRDILRLVDNKIRRFRDALQVVEWVGVEVAAEAMEDADTPDELARLIARSGR